MANTPPGSPYVESSDLVANYPAVSEDLAERVDLVGIIPFANAAARTTAFPTPTDGQYSYLQDTNATEFYDGANWVPAGITPGLVHINTTSFSASGGVNLNNVFTNTYDNYRIVLDVTASTANTTRFRFRNAGTDDTGANYNNRDGFLTASYSTAGGATDTSTNLLETNTNKLLTSGDIGGVRTASPKSWMFGGFTTAGSRGLWFNGGINANASTFDGFSLTPSTGTITGTVRVYGYKNS